MKVFVELRAERRETVRPALIWIETPAGLKPQRILLGLSDESFSEILRGEVKEGERVVTRARADGAGGAEGRRRRGG